MLKNDFGYNERLPENIRDIFMCLCQDVESIQNKWDFLLELGGNKQNTDLMSELAPASFNIIFETVLNDITIAISRLSDPDKNHRNKNLSLITLVNNCPKNERVDILLEDFQEMCKPVNKLRNKRIGHRDLDSAIKPLENPLPSISIEQIDGILKTAETILNSIIQNYDNCELIFHRISPGGAKTLIYWLKKGKTFSKQHI